MTNTKNVSVENYTINRGESKSTYIGNYFSSRSEHGHLVSGSQPTQESISVSQQGDQYEVISTLQETLDTVYLTIGQSHYMAKNVTTGNPVIAEPVSESEWKIWHSKQKDKFAKLNRRLLDLYGERKNSFVALASDGKGIDTHLSINWDTEMVITGKLNTNSQ